MANVHRGMTSRNQTNQFVQSPQFHHGTLGESRPYLNHHQMPPPKSIPVPSFNPAVPPPRFNATSLPPNSLQGMPTSHSYPGSQSIHVSPQFSAHGSMGSYAGLQKEPNNTLPVAPFHHGNNVPFSFPPPVLASTPTDSPPQSTSLEESDRLWIKHWLERHHVKPSITIPKKSVKIGEVHKLFQKWLSFTEQLTISRDELMRSIDSPVNEWNECLARTNEIKNKLLSIQETFSDPVVINNLQEKIDERKKKRLWFKNRMKRRYLEKREDEKRRERLHKEIDEWQNEKREKDLAARKEASLKHEAGGVLGEVRRKQNDGRKLLELVKSISKLREIRKSEGEKKGVYPKTSAEDDRNFMEKSECIKSLASKRIQNYEDEEKALRVMMVEEEEEREKKEEQERLEQKALLNLSRESDPLADFRRYYGQSEERLEYLVQIRREWDAYLVPNNAFGASRIPDGEISPGPPSSNLWSAVLTNGDTEAR